MEQREVDNMLLSMIQKHFPSLPLSDEHTDWGKWLGFARAVYEAGRASPASVPGWKLVPDVPTSTMVLAGEKALSEHDFLRMDSAYCAMLATAPTPPVSEDRWQPIETAPKYGRFLAVLPSGVMTVVVWLEASHPDADGEGWYEHWKFDPVDPTHWMPLPKAPEMEGK